MSAKKHRATAPQAVTDWIGQVIDDVFEEKQVKATDPKNLDVQGLCPTFPLEIPCFVEISKGSHNKYEWDVKHNIMVLDRVLSSAVFYPYDYGFIPQTICEDGDPLDVLVIGSNPVIPGVVVRARPLGYLDFRDVNVTVVDGKKHEELVADEKVLAVLAGDRTYDSWTDLSHVPASMLDMITEFFSNYKNLEKKSILRPNAANGWRGAAEAFDLIKKTHRAFTDKVEAGLADRQN